MNIIIRSKILWSIVCVLAIKTAYAQKYPKEYMSFIDHRDRWFINNIILSDDSVFFYLGCGENNTYLSKGKWTIKEGKLILNGFDSSIIFPKAKMEFSAYKSKDSVHILVLDYFDNPAFDAQIDVYGIDGKMQPFFPDSAGNIYLSRDQCVTFGLDYELRQADNPQNINYSISTKTNKIIIYLDYPIGLYNELFARNFKAVFDLKDGRLYRDGNLVYDKPTDK